MRTALLLAALAMATPAAAQPAPEPDSDDIVVTGDRQIQEAIQEFVRVFSGPVGDTDPIAKFDAAPVCPIALGLRPERNAEIAGRVRRVAQAAGMELAPRPDCLANVLILFTRDKEEMLRVLRRRYGTLFDDSTDTALRSRRAAGPVAAWHVERMVDRYGVAIGQNEGSYAVYSSNETPSRISAAVRRVTVASVVIIELNSLVGLTTTQIADYAAMRAFTKVDPRRAARLAAPTILSAIEAPTGTMVPITLTPWDMNYLRALAAVEPMHYGHRQRSSIRTQMLNELQNGAEAGDEPPSGEPPAARVPAPRP